MGGWAFGDAGGGGRRHRGRPTAAAARQELRQRGRGRGRGGLVELPVPVVAAELPVRTSARGAFSTISFLSRKSKATGDLVPKRLTNDRVDMLHVVYVFQTPLGKRLTPIPLPRPRASVTSSSVTAMAWALTSSCLFCRTS